ncbi:hypothetical protein A9K65_033815 (plasmid) [Mesorhizobium sp. WSM1497]|uniref:adenylate/guanylate cyclase domain-containing protein n=1 Tax=Mesorhizobium sp. WSM1497 TaxID=278153 RepID=UPI000A04B845|nr:adenylate/guanylate cyclase domain-containing protein [Mesorhizobium sp. WSM1497]ARP68344.1 hypothetical protein A9K65_033815 [Mesorhizobium sp. WSM1497]
MAEQQTTRRLSAILAADVVGYSSMMGIDGAGTVAALRQVWQETFNPALTARHGRIVKMMGDGALAEFPSVVSAVECAAAIQRAMGQRNLIAGVPIQFRIGINLGDVIVEGDDIFGDGVNIAARIEAIAKPGGVSIRYRPGKNRQQARTGFRGYRQAQPQEHPTADTCVQRRFGRCVAQDCRHDARFGNADQR